MHWALTPKGTIVYMEKHNGSIYYFWPGEDPSLLPEDERIIVGRLCSMAQTDDEMDVKICPGLEMDEAKVMCNDLAEAHQMMLTAIDSMVEFDGQMDTFMESLFKQGDTVCNPS